MSILISKDKKELIVSCNCGCNNGLRLKIDKEDPEYFCYTSYLNGNWYRDQDKKIRCVVWEKIKKIIAVIFNKDFCYSEVIMTKEDFKVFKEYINGIDDE